MTLEAIDEEENQNFNFVKDIRYLSNPDEKKDKIKNDKMN